MTEITLSDLDVCATGATLPEPQALTLPLSETTREAHEGMYVTLPQSLSILEYFEFGRFGTIDLGLERQYQPTALFDAGSPEAIALAQKNAAERITLDDGRGTQNPEPAIHPNGQPFSQANSFRGGDIVTNATGILDYRFSTWALQPTQGADFEAANPRTGVPDVGGDIRVASFNVLNYFETIDPTPSNSNDDDYTRGADSQLEFDRQEAKIVSALAAIDADVFGLMEIENNGHAVATLTKALNDYLGSDAYDYIDTGVIGTDAITTALIYKPATVTPVGGVQLMTQAEDPRWLDDFNRPAVTQTFADADGGTVTVVVNHLKSKGSDCNAVGDPDTGDGQGNCNETRTQAAAALADWLATDPTGQGAGRELIIGDLNSYTMEDPIQALTGAGFTDVLGQFEGPDAYSYVFDGLLGHLDHALAGTELVAEVTGAASWAINADEPTIFDYQTEFKSPQQVAMFQPDPYRSSDHDPVIIGLDLTPPDTTAPVITATASPAYVFPPNNLPRTVTVDVVASDDRGDVTVELTAVTADGKKAAVEQVTDREFRVIAANGARYSFTYTATDAAGNTATATATVVVGPKGSAGAS
jgi:predicted extracellular nuclease